MQFLYKIPGYILLIFGGFCLSWGGFIVKSFENSSVWQILFLRSFFFLLALTFFLLFTYKDKALKIIKDSGYPAVVGGFFMSFSFVSFVSVAGMSGTGFFFWSPVDNGRLTHHLNRFLLKRAEALNLMCSWSRAYPVLGRTSKKFLYGRIFAK